MPDWEGKSFEAFVPILKSTVQADGSLVVAGVCTDESRDVQQERLPFEVMRENYDYLKSWGKLNLDHREATIGDVLEIGSIAPEDALKSYGVHIEGRGTEIRGKLYPIIDPRVAPEDLKEARHLLQAGAKLGWSVQGKCKRVPHADGSRTIVKALVNKVSLTTQPVNTNTYATLVKSMAEVVPEVEGEAPDTQVTLVMYPALAEPQFIDLRKSQEDTGALDAVRGRVTQALNRLAKADCLQAEQATIDAAQFRGGRSLLRERLGDKRRRTRRRATIRADDKPTDAS